MAAEEAESRVNAPPPRSPPPFLEVVCKVSGQRRRFAAGTEAGYAVSMIDSKLLLSGGPVPSSSHIEAVKEGEEPVIFGPTSLLVDYGDGWELHRVNLFEGLRKVEQFQPPRNRNGVSEGLGGSYPKKTGTTNDSSPAINFFYIGKIFVAFILIFILGAALTMALENLPKLILLLNSSM